MSFAKTKLLEIIIFTVFILLVAVTSFYLSKEFSNQKTDSDSVFNKERWTIIMNSLVDKKFSKREYDLFQKELEQIVMKDNPREALEELRSAVLAGKVGKDCHNLTHNIGQIAYKKYEDPIKAFEYREQVCGYGYIHGVIISFLEDKGNPLEEMATTCESYNSGREKLECYHAMGHAFMMLLDNNLPVALEMCSQYKLVESKVICGQGVFMENFSPNNNSENQFRKKEDLFYPCAEQEEIYKRDCYKMAPQYYLTLHEESFGGILAWCQGAPKPYDYWCVRGASLQLMQYSLKMDQFEQFCLSGTQEQIAPCIQEMVRNKTLYHPEEVDAICRHGLKDEYTKKVCVSFSQNDKKD